MSHLGSTPTYVPCDTGYYCPGFGDGRIACPVQMTTTAKQLPASTNSDCVCLDPRMQLLPAQLQQQQAPGQPDGHQCVCRAGWLQSR